MRILVVVAFFMGLLFFWGNTASGIIDKYMDNQAEEVKKEFPNAKVVRVGEGENAKVNITFDSMFLFDTGKSDLKSSTVSNLNKLVDILQKYPDTKILIEGHTDSIGKESTNMRLSERRAKAVQDYLIQQKVDRSRMTVGWYGNAKPIASNNTEEGRSQNRRVEISITASDKLKAEEKRAVADETALKIAELQKEIDRLKKELEMCMAKNEELTSTLKKKNDTIDELEAKIKSLKGETKKQAELKGQLEDMLADAKSTAKSKDELSIALKEKDAIIAEKEARISKMEIELMRIKEELNNLEGVNRELKGKFAKSDDTDIGREMVVRKAVPVEKKGYLPAVAAMAATMVGAMIWVISK